MKEFNFEHETTHFQYNLSNIFLVKVVSFYCAIRRAFAVLANRRVLLVPGNAEKNMKTITKTTASSANHLEFSPKFACFSW